VELITAESQAVSPLNDTPISVLDTLLERNEVRTQLMLNNAFFLMWREGKLDDEQARRTMLKCLALLADTFGTSPPSRQTDDRSDDGRTRYDAFATGDPILRAISTWYRHQVLTLDEAGKTVLGIVLETTGYYLGVLAGPVLAHPSAQHAFDTPAEREARQREAFSRFPLSERPHTYGHLHTVLEDAWDMLDQATTRIAVLVSGTLGSVLDEPARLG
jgi:hypothetical protein